MNNKQGTSAFILVLAGLVLASGGPAQYRTSAGQNEIITGQGQSPAEYDLRLSGTEVVTGQLNDGRHVLVFEGDFVMSIGSNRFSGNKAVVWLKSAPADEHRGGRVYQVRAYLAQNPPSWRIATKAADSTMTDFSQQSVEDGLARVVTFGFTGRIFVMAQKKDGGDPTQLGFYKQAAAAVPAPAEGKETPTVEPGAGLKYPVDFSPVGQTPLSITRTKQPDGTYIASVMGRFYLSQKQQSGALLELQADNTVIFYSKQSAGGEEKAGPAEPAEDIPAGEGVKAVYMCGDVIMTEGQRTINTDEIYYDFEQRKGLAVNAAMRTFDTQRGIPVYVRAARLRQEASNRFAADDVTLTTSEFHLPQISFHASSVIITDTTPTDQQQAAVSDSSYDAQMSDVRLRLEEQTIFYWPFVRSNFQRPDVPVKSIHAGYDSRWGGLIETRWYFSRLLGLREAEGSENTFMLDYYGKRGIGTGVELNYTKEDYFGNLLAYMIDDHGEDDLGRDPSRRDIEPPRELRGRLHWQHRQFLPYNWQLTAEVGYLSDENFLESFYRNEFNTGKQQETLVHLKRIEDNWGLSVLGKGRINDFADELEELPSVEHHLTGQSVFEDKLTFYSDSQLGRFRQRLDSASPGVSEEFFTFASERAELDMPLQVGTAKVVPFAAGTVAYDDGSGFGTNLDGQPEPSEDAVWIGEAGLRASRQYWRVYPGVNSRVWDLDQLRHIFRPYATAVSYTASDSVADQRDTVSLGMSQRLQTKRGPEGSKKPTDWMRLDTEITWVNDSGDTAGGPNRFVWNKPFIPLIDTFSPLVPAQDRRTSEVFGPRRNYVSADYAWNMSDTTALLSDMNFDIQSGVVQQFDIGISRFRWPNLSYYIGSRYLRRIEVLDEKGSNAFVFAATYKLDPRYTLVFSNQFDFDYGQTVRSDITLIRRYHRICWGLTFSADQSLDRTAVVFSIWPQGVPELGVGSRRYMRLGDSENY